MNVIIAQGKRALSLRVDDVIGVAGFIQPNSRVDVLLTLSSGGATGEPTTKAILQNVEALAIGQTTQTNAQGQAQVVPVVTVLVTPEQAETLGACLESGPHSDGDAQPARHLADQDQRDASERSVRAGARRRAPTGARVSPRRRRGVARATAATEETIVEGFRGGERSITRFSRPKPPEDRDNK